MAPCTVLDVSLDIFLGSDGRAGENLRNINGLAGHGVTGKLDGFIQGRQIGVVVADAGVEVVEGDLGHVEGVSGLQGHSPRGVARVSLQDSPGEPVMFVRGVDAVVREVAAEVNRPTEAEDVEAVVCSDGALVEHCRGEAGGRVDTAVSEDGRFPAVDAGVFLVADAEGAAVQAGEVVLDLALDGDLVVVLQVGADTGQVLDDLDAELVQLFGWTNAAQLEDLGRVVDTAGDDYFTRCRCKARDTGRGGLGQRAGLVEVSAVEEVDAGSTGGVVALVEGHFGNVGVHADVKGVFLRAIIVLRIPDSNNELASAVSVSIVGRDGNLIVAVLGIAGGRIGIGIASKQSANVEDVISQVSKSKSTAGEHAEQLGVLEDEAQGGSLGREPAIVAVALHPGEQVVVLFHLGEVFAHVIGRPGAVASQGRDVFKVGLVGVDCNQGIVGRTSSEGS